MTEPIRRLRPPDASNLSYETVATPLYIGTIAILEAAPLTDPGGSLACG
jgi:hypothetical protein